jgi:hypothetical protein
LLPNLLQAPLTDPAFIQLVKSANLPMLDLANGNHAWPRLRRSRLSVVADGPPVLGRRLVANATRDQAPRLPAPAGRQRSCRRIRSVAARKRLGVGSRFPTPTGSDKPVYNFAIARVRLGGTGAPAPGVRVFFRVFPRRRRQD